MLVMGSPLRSWDTLPLCLPGQCDLSLLFFSALIRIQILCETSNYDITFLGFCICSVSLLHWAWRAGASHPFFADWMRISLILSFLVAWYFTSQQDCMICVLWAIYIYAFKEQTALFLPRRLRIKLLISSQYFTETVVFERKCHFTSTLHTPPLYTQTFTHSQRTWYSAVFYHAHCFFCWPCSLSTFSVGILE